MKLVRLIIRIALIAIALACVMFFLRQAVDVFARVSLADALAIGRSDVIGRLGAAGIGTSVHFIPLHLHPHYLQRYGYAPGDFPVAESSFERSISLPIWPGMSDAQVDRVSATLLEICNAARRSVEA